MLSGLECSFHCPACLLLSTSTWAAIGSKGRSPLVTGLAGLSSPGLSMYSMNAICAVSLGRRRVRRILVYPPFLFEYCSAISLKSLLMFC